MAKGSRGGKRSGNSSIAASAASATLTLAANPVQSISATFNSFMTLSDDDKAKAINVAISQGVPAHLLDNDFQRFIYNMKLNDKPEVVDAAAFAKLGGETVYRTVNAGYDRVNDIGYNAIDISKQIQYGTITRVSDDWKSALGRGLYFANDWSSSAVYGDTRGNVNKTAMVKGKLNSNARKIDFYTAQSNMRAEINNRTKLGRALENMRTIDAVSIYALSKGYNVLVGHNAYRNVLNRQAVTMCDSIDPI